MNENEPFPSRKNGFPRKRGLSIRNLNLVMIVITLTSSILLLSATFRANAGYAEMRTQTANYIRWQRDASDLQIASDYLTEQVRCFAETGERGHLDNYFYEAKVLRHRENALRSLREYLGERPAYASLEAAMGESVTLMEREYYSMRLTVAACGYPLEDFPEEVQNVRLTEKDAALPPEEQAALARSLVFDDVYEDSKAVISDHTQLCLAELTTEIDAQQASTLDRLNESLNRQRTLILLSIAVTIVTILLTLLLVISPLLRAVVYIRADQPIPIGGSSEFQFLARTYNLIYEANREKREQLAYDATHDKLTGVYNRAGYDFYLNNLELDTSALLLIDVDKFKGINDTYGHDAGDRVLARVAELLRSSFRSKDYVCRIGGDEFAVILTHAQTLPSGLIDEKLRRINAELERQEDDLPPVSLSCGVAMGNSTHTPTSILKAADAALYRVKATGGRGSELHA